MLVVPPADMPQLLNNCKTPALMAAPDASEEGFVKRSRGHIVVASWLVAAGLLSVGSGILGAAPASAEPGGRPGVQIGPAARATVPSKAS